MKEVYTTYLDFELEIGPSHGRDYPVTVTQAPRGEARGTMRFPYEASALEKRLVVVQNALLGSGGGPQLAFPEELVVRDFGRDLFEALFNAEIRRCYEQSLQQARQENKGLSLKLRFQPSELAALPWEYLYDQRQGEYVCLARSASLVRCLGLPGAVSPPSLGAPLHILAMIADPGHAEPEELARQKEPLETALQSLQAQGLVQLTWLEGPTWHHVQQAKQGGTWHVFHLLSQGGFSPAGPKGAQPGDKGSKTPPREEGEMRPLNPADLARTLADHPSLGVALLSARAGARGASLAGGASLRSVFTSTAAHLVQQGIPAVLTMPYEMTDQAAVELFRAFYRALALGIPVDAAVAEARKVVKLAVPNGVEWGAAALFMGLPDRVVSSARGRPASVPARVIEEQPRAPARIETPVEVIEPRPVPPREPRREPRPEREAPARTPPPVEPRPAPVSRPEQVKPPAPPRRPARETPVRTPPPAEPRPAPVSPPEKVKPPAPPRRPAREAPVRTPPPAEPPPAPVSLPEKVKEPALERRPKRVIPKRAPLPIQPELILIPAGEFLMGSQPERDQMAYEAEYPQHGVYLPDYRMAKTPITHAQYAAFVKASGHPAPYYWVDGKLPEGKEDYPVAYVSWYDALAYCKWLSKKQGRTYRLPSEAEWEKAARGSEGRIYPWGDAWDPACCNSKESRLEETTPAHAFPEGASPYGILDMAGNVWEWTGSLYKPYPYDAKDGREDPQAFGKRVLRSGAYYSTARRVRCAYRDSGYTEDSRGSYGFRVVLAAG
ncbi:MAG: SUMF1/EgtB/PvdO family nonheme iron enzyme [Anaerolineales bacterium]|nr:MAG: SUMF1/EgtB/PvdO family nonheme iron enzyme [Anaerolineales bacterium]